MKIYLIRHGQTDWNSAGKIQGGTDIELNSRGRLQSESLAKGMDSYPVAQIFCSPLKRALETAKVIGKRQKAEIFVVDKLQEMAFGRWEGLTWEQIKASYPEEYQIWRAHPMEYAPSGGETQLQLSERSISALYGIIHQAKGDVAVVTHGATLICMLTYLFREHPEEIPQMVGNASITILNYSPLTQDFSLLTTNNRTHLTYQLCE